MRDFLVETLFPIGEINKETAILKQPRTDRGPPVPHGRGRLWVIARRAGNLVRLYQDRTDGGRAPWESICLLIRLIRFPTQMAAAGDLSTYETTGRTEQYIWCIL